MMVVIAAAALGAFGGGWLSRTAVVSDDGTLLVRYEHFVRTHTPAELELEWQGGAGEVTFWVDEDYLEHFELTSITPMPRLAEVGDGRTFYTFAVRAKEAAARVRFRLAARAAGRVEGRVGRADGAPVTIVQRVFP
jgi:hypothetical protein